MYDRLELLVSKYLEKIIDIILFVYIFNLRNMNIMLIIY